MQHGETKRKRGHGTSPPPRSRLTFLDTAHSAMAIDAAGISSWKGGSIRRHRRENGSWIWTAVRKHIERWDCYGCRNRRGHSLAANPLAAETTAGKFQELSFGTAAFLFRSWALPIPQMATAFPVCHSMNTNPFPASRNPAQSNGSIPMPLYRQWTPALARATARILARTVNSAISAATHFAVPISHGVICILRNGSGYPKRRDFDSTRNSLISSIIRISHYPAWSSPESLANPRRKPDSALLPTLLRPQPACSGSVWAAIARLAWLPSNSG